MYPICPNHGADIRLMEGGGDDDRLFCWELFVSFPPHLLPNEQVSKRFSLLRSGDPFLLFSPSLLVRSQHLAVSLRGASLRALGEEEKGEKSDFGPSAHVFLYFLLKEEGKARFTYFFSPFRSLLLPPDEPPPFKGLLFFLLFLPLPPSPPAPPPPRALSLSGFPAADMTFARCLRFLFNFFCFFATRSAFCMARESNQPSRKGERGEGANTREGAAPGPHRRPELVLHSFPGGILPLQPLSLSLFPVPLSRTPFPKVASIPEWP